MTLRHGLELVAIPGPSILPERVRAELSRPMPNIYDGELVETSDRVLARLPGIARTSGHGFITIGNGHAAWQMSIDNLLVPGDKVLVLESGAFAVFWGECAAAAGIEVEVLPGDRRGPVDIEALHERLLADDGSISAILVAHTDTASSVRNDIAELRKAIDRAEHKALLMVDAIASIGAEEFEMDEWGVDVTIGASQKGLMCPPGVSFVWAGDKALARYEELPASRPHSASSDWAHRITPEAVYRSYAGTPPVMHLRALDVAFDMIDEEGGLPAVWARHQVLSNAVRSAVETWSTPGGIDFNITDPAFRSNAVTTVKTGSIDAVELGRICQERFGVTIGIGLANAQESTFRIGHMGHLNPPMVLGALGSIEAALVAMGSPIGGSGVAAASAVIGSASK